MLRSSIQLRRCMKGSLHASTRPLLIALALVIAVAVSARAADTGTVSGVVFDQNGAAVTDAAVKVSGGR